MPPVSHDDKDNLNNGPESKLGSPISRASHDDIDEFLSSSIAALPNLAYSQSGSPNPGAGGLRDRRASSIVNNDHGPGKLSNIRMSLANSVGVTTAREHIKFDDAIEGHERVHEETFDDEEISMPMQVPRYPQGRPGISPHPSYYDPNSGVNTGAATPMEEDGMFGNVQLPRKHWYRMASAFMSYGTGGWADGTPGALLPRIEGDYGLRYITVSTIFIASTIGFLTGTFLNEPMITHLGLFALPPSTPLPPIGRFDVIERVRRYIKAEKGHSLEQGRAYTLTFACTSQLIYFLIASSHPPFWGMLFAFFFGGLGLSILTGQLNTFAAASPRDPGKWLGYLHGSYGCGAFLSPLVSTALVGRGVPWYRFYYLSLGLAVINTSWGAYAFQPDSVEQQRATTTALEKQAMEMQVAASMRGHLERVAEQDGEGMSTSLEAVEGGGGLGARREEVTVRPGVGARKKSQKPPSTMKRTLQLPFVWVVALFIFFATGFETTVGGWVVTFLQEVRHGDPANVGYAASGYWGGFTLGRIVYGTVSPYLKNATEKHLVLVFILVNTSLSLVVWLVPSVLVGAVCTAVVGFCVGPLFPITVVISSMLLPREVNMTALSFISSAASIGSALYPFILGALASGSIGVIVLQPFLIGLSVVMAALWTLIPAHEGQPHNLMFGIGSLPGKVVSRFRGGY